MKAFCDLILSNTNWLSAQTLKYAKEFNYVKYTSTLVEAWHLSIKQLSNLLTSALEAQGYIPELGPDEEYSRDPISLYSKSEAQKHRKRGVSLGMFLGLFKYYRQSYIDLLSIGNFDIACKQIYTNYINRFFDRAEIALSIEWAGLEKDDYISELQEGNRLKTNEKNKYLTVFESLPNPALLINKKNEIENFNLIAAELFLGNSTPGSFYYNEQGIEETFPWLKEILEKYNSVDEKEVEFEKEILTFIGYRNYQVKLLRLLDCSEKFCGAVIIFNDITEYKKVSEDLLKGDARSNMLAKITKRLNEAGLDYQTTLDTVAKSTAELFGDTCIIRVLTEDKQLLNPVAFCISEKQKAFTDEIFATSVNVEGSLFEKIVSNENPFLVSVITEQNKPELEKDLEYINVLQAKSILISPLKVQGNVIGTLGIVCSCPDKPYTDQDQVFLQTLADRVSLAISNSQLYSDNLNKLKNLSALYSAAQKVVYSLDPVEIGKDISKTCVEEFGVSFAWIGFVQDDQSLLEISHYSNYELADSSEFFSDSFREQDDLVRSAIKDYRPIIKNSNNNELNLDLKSHCSTAAFPLISRNNSFGVLFLFCEEQFFFTPEKVEFLQAYVNQAAAAALENARLFEDAHRRLQHIQALRNIDMAITGSLDLRVTFNVVLDQVVTQLGVDAACILLLVPDSLNLECVATRGFYSTPMGNISLRLADELSGRVVLERRIVNITNLEESLLTSFPFIGNEAFRSYYGVPLIAKGQVQGVLEVYHRSDHTPYPEWLEFLEVLAGQAAIAVDNIALFNTTQQSNFELSMAYDDTIEGWSRALDIRDEGTEGHSQRVTELTLRLAKIMGVHIDELVHIRRGALLHDMGKMGIPDSILLKPGPLTEEEWVIMRRHPVYAFEILGPINYLLPSLDIPYCHHEKWDGTGYPRGLKGKQIPLAARIFAIIDVWDALTSDRPYRDAWPKHKAFEYISSQAGKHFDPDIVHAFRALILDD